MRGSIVRATVQISILRLLIFLKVIFFYLSQFGSQDMVSSFSFFVHTMGLARLHFSLCLSVTKNTSTCAYTVDTSTNGQSMWISVCIAGGEEGRGEESERETLSSDLHQPQPLVSDMRLKCLFHRQHPECSLSSLFSSHLSINQDLSFLIYFLLKYS